MSKLLFVQHHTPDGRPGRVEKAQIHAHTLQHNRRKAQRCPTFSRKEARLPRLLADRTKSSETQLGVVVSQEDVETDTPPHSNVVANGDNVVNLHHSTVSAPMEITVLGQYGENINSIGQWYFHSQLNSAQGFDFSPAQTHWTDVLWGMARVNQPVFAAVGAFTLHKEVTLAKRPSSAYLEQKGRTIWQISNGLRRPHCASDPYTMVAIVLLAYMDLRDGNFAAAKTHLEAFRDLVDLSVMPTYGWRHCVWVDLRYALLTGQAPIIPHHIPPSLRRDSSTRSPQLTRMASDNVANCPQASFFTHQIAFELFDKLHAVCRYPNQSVALEGPPFGQVYDVEYSLRTIQSQVSKNELRDRNALAVELVLLVVQLHLWMASRFWTPQRRESHLAVVSRACSIIDAFQDIATRWVDFGSADSLLWVLFTMTASVHVHAHSYRARLISLLCPVVNLLNIKCYDDFSGKLTRWPWIEDWHPVHTQMVWSALSETMEDLVAQRPRPHDISTPATPIRSQQRLFLGGLEFYNSS